MNSNNSRWTLARGLTFAMVLLPVLFFVLVVGNIVYTSLPAIQQVGLGVMLSTKFSNIFSGVYTPGEYGLMPALWGTLLVAALALLFALPLALALAVFATEFSLGRLGKGVEVVLSVFSGIPPVIYGLLSVFVINLFVLPKFCADGKPEEFFQSLPGLPPYTPGLLPREDSTLLGGFFLCLLIVPFMTPLIVDAIRCVPQGLKEASLGLGATRWYTLLHVTIPCALPGIIMAVSLGVLKSIGDVIISAWTIGFFKSGMPNPLVDVFERVAPLTSTSAGLLRGLSKQVAYAPKNIETSVAYFAALLLVVLAFVIQGLAALVQRSLLRRYAQ